VSYGGTADGLDLTPDDQVPTEELDGWFNFANSHGEFETFGRDIAQSWGTLSAQHKLVVRRAWRLTRHYLNGVQKRRERGSAGVDHRFTGDLSMYMPFLDIHLNRGYVEHAEMRVSFPYYIGPSTWSLFHCVAEASKVKGSIALIADFKKMLLNFPRVYACPYCRHHMWNFVFQNKEPALYPLEWSLIGANPSTGDVACAVTDKVAAVSDTDARAFRLFIWKLHNAVSSSISRQEEWYQTNAGALYTNRFWPSLESELGRANALKAKNVPLERLQSLYGTLIPSVQLGLLRKDLLAAIQSKDVAEVTRIHTEAQPWIVQLEDAFLNSDVLSTNAYNPDKDEANPAFTAEEEEYARGGMFEAI